ncbi:MAG TPA: PEP-CTERM sorting domain-containing protein [Bryobacteraceae bacterium]|jgi:hypothetical protein|nr:PEP-CTERM sorting domain-containing protein [Bryobacteraceae bacterium]
MNRGIRHLWVIAVAGAIPLCAQVDIGEINLSGSNFGYQTVGLYNFTGATQGCTVLSPQYNVCNALDITSWQLEVDFTGNVNGLPTSPLIFDSNGSNADIIGPTDASFDLFTGDPSAAWSVPFDLTNTGCQAVCDAYISKVVFTGTLDTDTLQLFNGAVNGPYSVDSLASPIFTDTWVIPSTAYTGGNNEPGANSTDSINLSSELLITNQTAPAPPGAPAAPEPGTIGLLIAGGSAIGLMKRLSNGVHLQG